MKENLKTEYLNLVKEMLNLFQKDRPAPPLPDSARPKKETSPVVPTGLPQKIVKAVESHIEHKPPSHPKAVEPPKAKKIIKEEKKEPLSGWDLQPMAEWSGESSFKSKLASHTNVTEPEVPVLIVLNEESASHRLFLESVSRAITKAYAPASVILYRDSVFRGIQTKLILAPLSVVKKKLPQAQAHQIYQLDHCKVIPLEDLDRYGADANVKRGLWNAIQLSFQSSSI